MNALIHLRWTSIWRRNFLVWRKQMAGSLIAHIAEPLITLLAFGLGLGALVGNVNTAYGTVPYLVFIASGSLCMSTMNSTTFEALYSAFSRLQMQRTWDGILNAAVVIDDIVIGEIIWSCFKGLFATCIIFIVMLCLLAYQGQTLHWHLLLVLPVLAMVALAFSCLAMIFTALAKGYDFFSFYTTLFLTPMMFMSGVFFPREQLPAWLQQATSLLPLTAAVQLTRPLFLGQFPHHVFLPIAILLLVTVVAGWTAIHLLRKRFSA